MKQAVSFFFFYFTLYICSGQTIQTIVPKEAVVTGTAFQIQYILTSPSEFLRVAATNFDSFKVISGPNYYTGTAMVDGKRQPIKNITYTLVPLQVGNLKIGSIRVNFKNGTMIESHPAYISVMAQPKASFTSRSSYTDVSLYAPASKAILQKLVDDNLFIKVEADKKTCYEGEPIVASFKLFSRLQSSSEAEKSPAFYGFSVVDMLNINEAHTAIATVNGKIFNTAVLRKVQLYPAQPGKLFIDAMYVQNEIEFDGPQEDKTKIEKEIITAPLPILVKPLPALRPENFTGAVGRFYIKAHLEKDKMKVGDQNKFIVIISGKGNFIQFAQPVILWPKGIDVFEPNIDDKLNKNIAPIEGERIYEFVFTTDSSSRYILPVISFSFFDPLAESFKTVSTSALNLHVIKGNKIKSDPKIKTANSTIYLWIITSAVLLIAMAIFIYRLRKGKMPELKMHPLSLDKAIWLRQMEAIDTNNLSSKETCIEIQIILTSAAQAKQFTTDQKEEFHSLISDCQFQAYSENSTESKNEELKKRAVEWLKNI